MLWGTETLQKISWLRCAHALQCSRLTIFWSAEHGMEALRQGLAGGPIACHQAYHDLPCICPAPSALVTRSALLSRNLHSHNCKSRALGV